MSNPFDNKIKEALEQFEMPYDATAWAELEKQLPQAGGTPPGNGLGLKLFGLFAAASLVLATIWYFNRPDTEKVAESTATEEVVNQTETVQQTESAEAESTEKSQTETASTTPNRAEQKQSTVGDAGQADEMKKNTPSENTQTSNAANAEKPAEKKVEDVQKADSAPIRIIPTQQESKILVIDFLPSSVNVCVGSDVTFMNESSDMKAKMHWNFGDGVTSDELNPVHNYIQPGIYTVTLVGSKNSQNVDHSVTVTVNPAPTPMFSSARKLDGYTAIPLYRFSTGTLPNETAVWSFSDGSKVSGNKADHLFREAGEHKAVLTVTNSQGCSTTVDESYETSEEFNLLAPEAFTPNGDGINELFMPVALQEMGVAFDLIIRDQTGRIVYQTSNAIDAWDGTMHNSGQKVDAGYYIWTVILKENIVNKKDFNGTIRLTR